MDLDLKVVETIEAKGVTLRILDLSIDTSTATGRMLLTMIGAIAQFERELMLERQREGIAQAKAEGRYKGRAPTERAKLDQIQVDSIGPGKHPAARLRRHRCARTSALIRVSSRLGFRVGAATPSGVMISFRPPRRCSRILPAMVRRWHADPFGFLRPWNELPALMGSAPPATPPSNGTGVVIFLMG